MANIHITSLSNASHISQILTGFHCLRKEHKISLSHRPTKGNPPLVMVEYEGKQLYYDTGDSYFDIPKIRELLGHCDFYFQRSHYPEQNRELFGELANKIYPLGMNYHISYFGNPVKKSLINNFRNLLYTPKAFEGKPIKSRNKPIILFCTRLWSRDPALSERLNQERDEINAMRIAIIRTLRKVYGKQV